MAKVGDMHEKHIPDAETLLGTFSVGLIRIVTCLNKSSLKIKIIDLKWQIKNSHLIYRL